MVSIVSCLSGTALRGRIARKTLVGILQMIVLVSLTTNQTDAKKNPAAACNGTWLKHPPTCNHGLTVNVLNVMIGSATPCEHFCCLNSTRCDVSADEVLAACQGPRGCRDLRAPCNWTSDTDGEDTDDGYSSSDGGGRHTAVYAKYVRIEYNCKSVPSASLPSPSRTTATEAPYDVTTDSGEASGRGSASEKVGVAVGVTVAVLVVVGVITAVLVIYFLGRRRKQMERQIGKDAMASHATPVPNSYDNAYYQEVIPSAPPPTPGVTTRDPPPLDPTASSGSPHPSSPGAAQDTDYDLVRSPYAKVQRPTSQDSEYDLRLMENPTYN